MQTPTTNPIRTASEVLEKLGESLNNDAVRAVMRLAATQLGDQHAARIGTRTLEQNSRIETVVAQLENWRKELKQQRTQGVFHLFKTSHALPLRAEGFHGREAVAVHPQNSHAI